MVKTKSYLTDSTASPVRRWGRCCWMKAGSGWTHCGDDSGGALRVLEESHWMFPRSEGRKSTRGLQWAEFFVCFGCECGTWQQHLSLREVRGTHVIIETPTQPVCLSDQDMKDIMKQCDAGWGEETDAWDLINYTPATYIKLSGQSCMGDSMEHFLCPCALSYESRWPANPRCTVTDLCFNSRAKPKVMWWVFGAAPQNILSNYPSWTIDSTKKEKYKVIICLENSLIWYRTKSIKQLAAIDSLM